MLAVYDPAEEGASGNTIGDGRNPLRHRHNEVLVAGSGRLQVIVA